MALRALRSFLTGSGVDLKVAVVPGAAANTPIAVSGLRRKDRLVAVLEMQPPTAVSGNAIVADRVGVATVGDGQITLSVGTAGNQLLILWWSVA